MDQVHIFVSGYSRRNNGEAGIGLRFGNDMDSEPFYEEAANIGVVTQQAAIYQAIKKGLEKVTAWKAQGVTLYTDNRLVAEQLNKKLGVRSKSNKPVYEELTKLSSGLDYFTVQYVPPLQNQKARELARAASLATTNMVSEQAIKIEVGPGISGVVLAFTPKLMIVRFVYKKGSTIPMHKHYHEQGSYILAGSLKYTLADRVVIESRGAALVVFSNTEHSVQALEDTVEIVTYAPMRADLLKLS